MQGHGGRLSVCLAVRLDRPVVDDAKAGVSNTVWAASTRRSQGSDRCDSKSAIAAAAGLFSPVSAVSTCAQIVTSTTPVRWTGVVAAATLTFMTSNGHHIPEVTYVTTALGCRLPFARVLCCRMS